uniref:Uncharacterized protein n=1 Tax=Rhizophora mucronata TaxID=61149 RepID=A0A2P2KSZ8_RHIMU
MGFETNIQSPQMIKSNVRFTQLHQDNAQLINRMFKEWKI